MNRRQRDKLRHKEEILKAALKLFSEKGFHHVSMQEIAEASEFGVGSLYNFFKSKEALFEELIDGNADYIITEYNKTLEGPGDEKARLSAFIKKQPDIQEKFGKLIRLYISEFEVRGLKLFKLQEKSQVYQIINSKLVKLIESGIIKGVFRPVDPEIAARSLSAAIESIILETTGRIPKDAVTDMFNKVEELFIDGLIKPE
ncbi:HTH-type transcriptional repressor KstR2 [Limihaloglobus sulfuriphilus]|uniref:HTH-type transcriptional repressor KstR2 n=1 Tax=Limihaloglobus sulfuriphilus TaxID=1851148 RepID=A0A1Q2MBN4_9BACT|nr:TetR/AcrR family transcriptional regulator [Limihaloglobus sulfuriphilus]AQQ69687.1 HTH-type transcriptional repressor KstR2 [Limihaloglobus sulfuriphilus]